MAGPYNAQLRFSNGQVLQCYIAANVAVGVYIPCDMNNVGATTSPIQFEVSSPCSLVDVITSEPGAAGCTVEFMSGGAPTGKMLPLNASFAGTNAGRPTGAQAYNVSFVPGRRYALLVRVAGDA